MKVIRVDARQVDMDLAEPYTIAYETVKSASNVFIEVRTDRNTSGYGCSAPDLQVTGENAASVLEAIDQTVRPVLSGANPLRYGLLLEILKKSWPAGLPHWRAWIWHCTICWAGRAGCPCGSFWVDIGSAS